jgi:hypothetical protein
MVKKLTTDSSPKVRDLTRGQGANTCILGVKHCLNNKELPSLLILK